METPKISYYERERDRVAAMVRRFLVPRISPDMDILSIGCGGGTDVMELRRLGYKAWGLDPSRFVARELPEEFRPYIRQGSIEDEPFNDKRFDFAYALDVIEHVGCQNFGTHLADDALEKRKVFLASCFKVLRPGGTLIITTSNRLCFFDPGHRHKYHSVGKLLGSRVGSGLSIPWHPYNFLLSLGDIRRLLDETVGREHFEISAMKTGRYPSVGQKKGLIYRLRYSLIAISDFGPLVASPFAPILVVSIRKRLQPSGL